jgi:hypothetical protein
VGDEFEELEGPARRLLGFADGRMPPRLEDVPPDDVAQWAAAIDAIQDPRLVSRIGDLSA